jgi:1,4-dihydroxy-2-naphthoate octaprenyltransferase
MLDRLKLWMRATLPFSFPCSMFPVLTAVAATGPISQWHWDRLAATVVLVLALHVAANMLNDYFDYASGVDRRVEEDEGRPGRLLVRGEMQPRQVIRAVLVALVLAAAATAYLVWRVDAVVLGFVALALFGAYSYTGPPLRLKARGLGEVAMLVFFGPGLMGGACYVQIRGVPMRVLLLAIPMGLAVSLILAGNNLRDLAEDAAGGARTLAHRIGPRPMAWLYCAMALACSVGMTAVGLAYGRALLALSLLALPFAAGPVHAVLSGRRLADIDVQTVKFMAALGAIATGVLIYTGGL